VQSNLSSIPRTELLHFPFLFLYFHYWSFRCRRSVQCIHSLCVCRTALYNTFVLIYAKTPGSSSAVFVMISSKSVSICNIDEPIVVKLRFLWRYPSLMPSFEGNLLTQRHHFTSSETPTLPYGENPESLSHLGLIRYRVVTPQTDRRTDRRTDRIPIANRRSQQYLPVQLSRVKINSKINQTNTKTQNTIIYYLHKHAHKRNNN